MRGDASSDVTVLMTLKFFNCMFKFVSSVLCVSYGLAASAASIDEPGLLQNNNEREFVLFDTHITDRITALSGDIAVELHYHVDMVNHELRSSTLASSALTLERLSCNGQVFLGGGMLVMPGFTRTLRAPEGSATFLNIIFSGINGSTALEAFITEKCGPSSNLGSQGVVRTFEFVEPVNYLRGSVCSAAIFTEAINGLPASRFHVERCYFEGLDYHPAVIIALLPEEEQRQSPHLRRTAETTFELRTYLQTHAKCFLSPMASNNFFDSLNEKLISSMHRSL